MAGIGSYEKGKKFTLKSGNTTPFKQMGSEDKHTEAKVGAAMMLTKKFDKAVKPPSSSYGKYLDKAAKASRDPYFRDVLGKKAFESSRARKLSAKAKNIKVDVSTAKKASKSLNKWTGLKKAAAKTMGKSYTPIGVQASQQATGFVKSTPTGRALKAFSNTPKQLAKGVIKKGAARYALPVIGEALMTYDVLKEGVKRVAKGIKTGKPQTGLYGKGPHAIGPEPKGHGGKTWSERRTSKKKYTK